MSKCLCARDQRVFNLAESGVSLEKFGASTSKKIQATVEKRSYSPGEHVGACCGNGAEESGSAARGIMRY